MSSFDPGLLKPDICVRCLYPVPEPSAVGPSSPKLSNSPSFLKSHLINERINRVVKCSGCGLRFHARCLGAESPASSPDRFSSPVEVQEQRFGGAQPEDLLQTVRSCPSCADSSLGKPKLPCVLCGQTLGIVEDFSGTSAHFLCAFFSRSFHVADFSKLKLVPLASPSLMTPSRTCAYCSNIIRSGDSAFSCSCNFSVHVFCCLYTFAHHDQLSDVPEIDYDKLCFPPFFTSQTKKVAGVFDPAPLVSLSIFKQALINSLSLQSYSLDFVITCKKHREVKSQYCECRSIVDNNYAQCDFCYCWFHIACIDNYELPHEYLNPELLPPEFRTEGIADLFETSFAGRKKKKRGKNKLEELFFVCRSCQYSAFFSLSYPDKPILDLPAPIILLLWLGGVFEKSTKSLALAEHLNLRADSIEVNRVCSQAQLDPGESRLTLSQWEEELRRYLTRISLDSRREDPARICSILKEFRQQLQVFLPSCQGEKVEEIYDVFLGECLSFLACGGMKELEEFEDRFAEAIKAKFPTPISQSIAIGLNDLMIRSFVLPFKDFLTKILPFLPAIEAPDSSLERNERSLIHSLERKKISQGLESVFEAYRSEWLVSHFLEKFVCPENFFGGESASDRPKVDSYIKKLFQFLFIPSRVLEVAKKDIRMFLLRVGTSKEQKVFECKLANYKKESCRMSDLDWVLRIEDLQKSVENGIISELHHKDLSECLKRSYQKASSANLLSEQFEATKDPKKQKEIFRQIVRLVSAERIGLSISNIERISKFFDDGKIFSSRDAEESEWPRFANDLLALTVRNFHLSTHVPRIHFTYKHSLQTFDLKVKELNFLESIGGMGLDSIGKLALFSPLGDSPNAYLNDVRRALHSRFVDLQLRGGPIWLSMALQYRQFLSSIDSYHVDRLELLRVRAKEMLGLLSHVGEISPDDIVNDPERFDSLLTRILELASEFVIDRENVIIELRSCQRLKLFVLVVIKSRRFLAEVQLCANEGKGFPNLESFKSVFEVSKQMSRVEDWSAIHRVIDEACCIFENLKKAEDSQKAIEDSESIDIERIRYQLEIMRKFKELFRAKMVQLQQKIALYEGLYSEGVRLLKKVLQKNVGDIEEHKLEISSMLGRLTASPVSSSQMKEAIQIFEVLLFVNDHKDLQSGLFCSKANDLRKISLLALTNMESSLNSEVFRLESANRLWERLRTSSANFEQNLNDLREILATPLMARVSGMSTEDMRLEVDIADKVCRGAFGLAFSGRAKDLCYPEKIKIGIETATRHVKAANRTFVSKSGDFSKLDAFFFLHSIGAIDSKILSKSLRSAVKEVREKRNDFEERTKELDEKILELANSLRPNGTPPSALPQFSECGPYFHSVATNVFTEKERTFYRIRVCVFDALCKIVSGQNLTSFNLITLRQIEILKEKQAFHDSSHLQEKVKDLVNVLFAFLLLDDRRYRPLLEDIAAPFENSTLRTHLRKSKSFLLRELPEKVEKFVKVIAKCLSRDLQNSITNFIGKLEPFHPNWSSIREMFDGRLFAGHPEFERLCREIEEFLGNAEASLVGKGRDRPQTKQEDYLTEDPDRIRRRNEVFVNESKEIVQKESKFSKVKSAAVNEFRRNPKKFKRCIAKFIESINTDAKIRSRLIESNFSLYKFLGRAIEEGKREVLKQSEILSRRPRESEPLSPPIKRKKPKEDTLSRQKSSKDLIVAADLSAKATRRPETEFELEVRAQSDGGDRPGQAYFSASVPPLPHFSPTQHSPLQASPPPQLSLPQIIQAQIPPLHSDLHQYFDHQHPVFQNTYDQPPEASSARQELGKMLRISGFEPFKIYTSGDRPRSSPQPSEDLYLSNEVDIETQELSDQIRALFDRKGLVLGWLDPEDVRFSGLDIWLHERKKGAAILSKGFLVASNVLRNCQIEVAHSALPKKADQSETAIFVLIFPEG